MSLSRGDHPVSQNQCVLDSGPGVLPPPGSSRAAPGLGAQVPAAGGGAERVMLRAHRSARFPRGRGGVGTSPCDLPAAQLAPLRRRVRVGRRPPSSGYAGQACCSHVGPVGVGSRAGVSRSQEAAALCTLLVPSCWWLPRGVASSPQQCAVQSPSARGVPGGGAPTRGEDTCRGASQPLQPTATAQAPFAYERPGGPGRANAP